MKPLRSASPKALHKVPTGITGFDEITGGGLPRGRTTADSILMTPTLLKLAPAPVRKIVGTLSQMQPLLQALGVEALAA